MSNVGFPFVLYHPILKWGRKSCYCQSYACVCMYVTLRLPPWVLKQGWTVFSFLKRNKKRFLRMFFKLFLKAFLFKKINNKKMVGRGPFFKIFLFSYFKKFKSFQTTGTIYMLYFQIRGPKKSAKVENLSKSLSDYGRYWLTLADSGRL